MALLTPVCEVSFREERAFARLIAVTIVTSRIDTCRLMTSVGVIRMRVEGFPATIHTQLSMEAGLTGV